MAGADKIFATKDQWQEFKDWLENDPVAMFLGIGISDWLWDDNNEHPIANYPSWVNYWLRDNCSLKFVKERIKNQYNSDKVVDEETINEIKSLISDGTDVRVKVHNSPIMVNNQIVFTYKRQELTILCFDDNDYAMLRNQDSLLQVIYIDLIGLPLDDLIVSVPIQEK